MSSSKHGIPTGKMFLKLLEPVAYSRAVLNWAMRLSSAVIIPYFILSAGCAGDAGNKKRVDKNQAIIRIKKLKQEASGAFHSFAETMGENEARQRTVEWARSQDHVKGAGLSKDGETIWILLDNGLEVDILAE